MIALAIIVLAVLLLVVGAVAVMAWQSSRRGYEELAERINVDARLEFLTTQTLASMRDAVRGHYRQDDPF